jgi:TRAP-type mannitol/chloroaromatic compound transport system substrate-binding protein
MESSSTDKPYVVEYYYKAHWGNAEEFIRLFKKNHYPVLKKQIEMGRILKVAAVKPRLHTTEEGRWDYRMTIVFKNVQVTADGFDEAALARTLFPDQHTFKKEEQRRFEILIGHWDVPVDDVDLEK